MSSGFFNIRVEYPDRQYDDFQVGAISLDVAHVRAEERIRGQHPFAIIEWRGLVAFVGHRPAEDSAAVALTSKP